MFQLIFNACEAFHGRSPDSCHAKLQALAPYLAGPCF
jgi:hypothetical protein